ncbi:hypothetical protein GOP47_0029181 [Adiantum capillus-veneris]|nr:hypothetical protein GOP47_0029181 [Adiantum capillus-veneris]
MRGLLSCRVLKGPSGAETFSKSLFRHSQRRKSSRRPPLRRPKTSLQTHSSLAIEGKEREEEASQAGDNVGGAHATCAVNRNHDHAKCHSINDTDDNDDVHDHFAAVDNAGTGLKDLHAMGIQESIGGDVNFGVVDVEENVTETEDSAEEMFEEEEEGREDRSHATPHAFGNGYKHSNEVSVSVEWHANNTNLQGEDNASNITKALKGPLILPDWEAVVSIIAETSATISFVCGGKNTGKSTFARYLINSLLKRYGRVGFLDTDVGQPEFTPSGCLSLHVLDKPIIGLPALEMKDPERCYFFGDISPKSNPEDYLDSIYSLYNHFNNKYTVTRIGSKVGEFPLVINTHGWIQGVGLDVLINLIRYMLPTHLVQTVSKMSTRNLPPNRFWESSTTVCSNAQLLYINNALGDTTYLAEIKYDSRELRDLRLLSYFQRSIIDKFMPTSRLSSLFEKAASELACCKPFQVPIAAINVVQQHFQVPAGEIIYSLNATLIGLGVSKENEQDAKPWCVGLGIVRAVDVSRGLFYVLTPLKLDVLQRVNTFIQGRIEIPAAFLKAPRYVSPYLCKNTITMDGTGSAAMGKAKKKVLRMLRSPGIW